MKEERLNTRLCQGSQYCGNRDSPNQARGLTNKGEALVMRRTNVSEVLQVAGDDE